MRESSLLPAVLILFSLQGHVCNLSHKSLLPKQAAYELREVQQLAAQTHLPYMAK